MSMSGVVFKSPWRVMGLGALLVIYAALNACSSDVAVAAPDPGQVNVKLKDLNPKVKNAVGWIIETNERATLDQGKLSFQVCNSGDTIAIWAPGYYITTLKCNGDPKASYEIPLERINPADNPGYQWVSARMRLDSFLECERCHSDASQLNEYPEWDADGHSRSFVSALFWTTYLGVNVNRTPGQKTLWGFSADGNRYRLPPDPNQPNYGPGYQLDYPDASGNCAFCHAPAAIGALQQEVNLAPFIHTSWGQRINVVTEGVTCDVCHKVIDVALDDQQLPYTDRPGILSFTILRPGAGEQFIAGPWSRLIKKANESNPKQTCSPVFSQSSFCAPCHFAKFSGTEIYGSYKEWLDSSYSKGDSGFRSCQDCHMPSSQQIEGTSRAARNACSAENLEFSNFSHNMMHRDNTGNPILVQGAATVTMNARKEDGKIKVEVGVVNTKAGHKLPTDSPMRHLILLVEARDENDRLLTQMEGPTIPAWGGTGSQPEDYAGKPGVIYANILQDKDTNMVPAVAYWNPVTPAWAGSDTRLRPNEYVLSHYAFTAQSHGDVRVTAKLLYRYAFIEIMRQKGWTQPDVLVNWYEQIVSE